MGRLRWTTPKFETYKSREAVERKISGVIFIRIKEPKEFRQFKEAIHSDESKNEILPGPWPVYQSVVGRGVELLGCSGERAVFQRQYQWTCT